MTRTRSWDILRWPAGFSAPWIPARPGASRSIWRPAASARLRWLNLTRWPGCSRKPRRPGGPRQAEPPAGLQARTLASVEQAATGRAGRGGNHVATADCVDAVAGRCRDFCHFGKCHVLCVAAGASARVHHPAAPPIGRNSLRPGNGPPDRGRLVHPADRPWPENLGPDRFYECWYAGPGSRPGHPDLITAGTFTVGPSGSATVQMWSAADPRTFPTMQITAERAGDARPARPDHPHRHRPRLTRANDRSPWPTGNVWPTRTRPERRCRLRPDFRYRDNHVRALDHCTT